MGLRGEMQSGVNKEGELTYTRYTFRPNLTGTNLSHADLKQGFLHDADLTGVKVYGIDLNPENLKGVKGLHMPLYCPEEGSFVA